MSEDLFESHEVLINSKMIVKSLNKIQDHIESSEPGLDETGLRNKRVIDVVALGVLFNKMMAEYSENTQETFRTIIKEMETNIFHEDVNPEKIEAKA